MSSEIQTDLILQQGLTEVGGVELISYQSSTFCVKWELVHSLYLLQLGNIYFAGKGTHVKASNVLNLFGKFFIKSKRETDAGTNKEIQGIWLLNTSDDTI